MPLSLPFPVVGVESFRELFGLPRKPANAAPVRIVPEPATYFISAAPPAELSASAVMLVVKE